mmetsp:Transcript_1432/g.3867  ORF Transcript_1432/g.3867 Transcript_1432/m.3867 type:complete len:298 (-) Transcript_1432:655-1548(-)
MVARFFSFSAARRSLASFTELSNKEMSFCIVAMSSLSCAILALPDSMSAVRPSMDSVSFVRVILLSPSSLSQKPLCSASPLASSSRRVIKSLINFLTLTNGSAAIFCANIASSLFFNRLPSCSKKSSTCPRTPAVSEAEAPRNPNCAMALPVFFAVAARDKCCSAAPCTPSAERISMAFSNASISSARNCCFSSKECCFSLHSTFVSDKDLASSTCTAWVELNCFFKFAASSCFDDLFIDLSETSCFAVSSDDDKSCANMSCACCEFISSFSSSLFFSTNSPRNRLSISTIPPDWNS